MALARSIPRTAAFLGAILLGSLVFAASSAAAPNKFGQRPSSCSKWDCQGGIICSCCFNNGCWICDADWTGKPVLASESCHWDDARQPAISTPATRGGTRTSP